MSVSKLIRHFEALGRVPVSMTEVVAEFRRSLLTSGLQVKGVDLPANVLRGTHFHYHHEPHPNSIVMPGSMALVVYSTQQDLKWQRLVCCKELIHVLDSPVVQTKDEKDIIKLGSKLADKSRHYEGASDLQWFFDDLAKYHALAILFPFSLREAIMDAYLAKHIDDAALSDVVQIPEEFVKMVMSDQWKLLRETILLTE